MIKFFIGAFLLSALFISCKTKYEYNAEGMQQLNTELKDQFGSDAWYTGITIRSISASENAVIVEQTRDPNSLKQEQWMKQGDSWRKLSNVALRIENGKPEDYMFRLDEQVSLSFLNELMQKCREKLDEVAQVRNAEVTFASIKSSNEVRNKDRRILYTISFRDPVADKSYSFVFDLKGKLINFNK